MLKYCEARPEKKVNKFIKPRTPWTYQSSIWSSIYEINYAGEKEELINEIFEHDFNRCQMNNFIKNDEVTNDIKRILRFYIRQM